MAQQQQQPAKRNNLCESVLSSQTCSSTSSRSPARTTSVSLPRRCPCVERSFYCRRSTKHENFLHVCFALRLADLLGNGQSHIAPVGHQYRQSWRSGRTASTCCRTASRMATYAPNTSLRRGNATTQSSQLHCATGPPRQATSTRSTGAARGFHWSMSTCVDAAANGHVYVLENKRLPVECLLVVPERHQLRPS
ncbi:unnamed protein product [Phaeothamnion confervicola]